MKSIEQVENICARIFPDEPLSERVRIVVEDIVRQLQSEHSINQERTLDLEDPGLDL